MILNTYWSKWSETNFYAWPYSNEFWIRATWIDDKNNNVYKTKRKETIHMLLCTISNLKSARTYKWRRVVLSRKPVCSGISKLIFSFPYSFHILCSILSTVYFHTVLPKFPFPFLLIALESRCCRFIVVSQKIDHRSVKHTGCNS